MFFNANDPAKQLKQAIDKGNLDKVPDILKEAVLKFGFQSQKMEELAVIVSAWRLPYLNFLLEYLRQNPNIVSGAQLRVAEIYAESGDQDLGAIEARNFLVKARRLNSSKNDEPVSRAYFVMASAFTRAGARSYSKSILEHVLALRNISPNSRLAVEREISNLNSELAEQDNKVLDKKWNDFYSFGENFDELYQKCINGNQPNLAKRIDIIRSQLVFTGSYPLNPEEFLKEVCTIRSKNGDIVYALQ